MDGKLAVAWVDIMLDLGYMVSVGDVTALHLMMKNRLDMMHKASDDERAVLQRSEPVNAVQIVPALSSNQLFHLKIKTIEQREQRRKEENRLAVQKIHSDRLERIELERIRATERAEYEQTYRAELQAGLHTSTTASLGDRHRLRVLQRENEMLRDQLDRQVREREQTLL